MAAWECHKDGLDSRLVAALEQAADEYHTATGCELRITSGRRTLRQQAGLMAAMTNAQLLALYAAHGTPDYIRTIITQRQHRSLSDDDVYAILRNRKEGYISAHLFGAAADLATQGVSNLPLLKKVLAKHGFAVLDERDTGIPCLHCRLRILPDQIITD